MNNKNTVIRAVSLFLFVAIVVLILATCTACGNRDTFDTNYTFDRAIVEMPGGEVIEIEIDKWRDYEGDQLQITAEDGTVYLVHSSDCVLIRD